MMNKLPTGCSGLDKVLQGGIPRSTLTVLMGAPGTGKTILAEAIAFKNATPERPALYLTTLSEPLEKFILHGQNFKFFESEKVGVSVFYEDLGLMVRNSGIEKLSDLIVDLFLRHRPQLLFIDSFKALNEMIPNNHDRRAVTYDLATALSAYECTSFLIGEYAEEMTTDLPEFAIADVVLNLMKYSTNVREQRFLRVEKLRGSDSIPGMHAFSITLDGIQMYPRLLTPRVTPSYQPKAERARSGITGLDGMVSNGFWRGSSTLLAGPSGSGKTVMALHFIREGALNGEPGVYLGFQENPEQLARLMQSLGWDAHELVTSGKFEIMYRSPVEMQMDCVADELFTRVREGKIRRVVIDALGDLARVSIDLPRFADFMYALLQWFAAENVTCVMTLETPELLETRSLGETDVAIMTDNLVLLGFTNTLDMDRTVRIIKTRGSAHVSRLHKLEIRDQGAFVKEFE